jgi:EAL domain-containing protein (putative c-di-GMP-specific phosphodiesterase class I)
LRRTDTIARLNGDEFAIVTVGSGIDHVMGLAARLADAFERPFELAEHSVSVGASMGLVITDDRLENANRLLESAGLALRHAKSSATSPVVFEQWMREAANERFELAAGLLRGIENDEFFVVYQPILNMASQQVSSTEALLRWNHPDRGFVSPAAFIPLAEQSGAIIELGRWVLTEACRQLVRWHDELPDGQGLSMSVNVSARQLEVPGEADRLKEIIEMTGVDPRCLILELTESVMLEDTAGLRQQLQEFQALGIRIAVDDFGTGAAGLGHLRDVPFDIVKIDKSYIDGLGESAEAHSLITGVIELAHGMRATIVAEGIETPQQAALLREMRCDYGQGFYLGRPMEPVQIETWFAAGRAGSAAASIAQPRGADNGRAAKVVSAER